MNETTQERTTASRWRAAGRLAVFCAVVACALLVWIQRRSMAERYHELGRPEVAEPSSRVDTVTVNGQEFASTVGHSPLPLATVLDSFQSWCRPHAGSILEWKSGLRAPRAVEEHAEAEYPLVRFSDEATGMATCLFLGKDPQIDFSARVSAAARHSDLSLVGQIRHIYAYKGESGTEYAVLWSTGSLSMKQFLADEVPGVDVAGVPRPTASKRTLSGHSSGAQINTYTAESSADELQAAYETSLGQSGWRVLPLTGEDSRALVAFRGDRVVWISLDDRGGDGSIATIVHNGSDVDVAAPKEYRRP